MKILVVGPHPDDQELGMGGTIARLADQGHDVVLVDMTNGEPTPFGDPVTRAAEADAPAAGARGREGGCDGRRFGHADHFENEDAIERIFGRRVHNGFSPSHEVARGGGGVGETGFAPCR